MPYKNPQEHREQLKRNTDKWREKQFPAITIRINRNDAAFWEALQVATQEQNVTVPEFMRKAAKEKLIRDGYLTDDAPSD